MKLVQIRQMKAGQNNKYDFKNTLGLVLCKFVFTLNRDKNFIRIRSFRNVPKYLLILPLFLKIIKIYQAENSKLKKISL